MSDFKILSLKDRKLLIGQTSKGLDWIAFQMGFNSAEFSVQNDVFDEAFLDSLREEGLTFEFK